MPHQMEVIVRIGKSQELTRQFVPKDYSSATAMNRMLREQGQ